jgi:hypothetical protein
MSSTATQPQLFEDQFDSPTTLGDGIKKRDKEAVRHLAKMYGFDEWYTIYPNKKQRHDAELAFVFNLPHSDRKQIIDLTQDYLQRRERAIRARYWVPCLPYPATYLNNSRWEDKFETDDLPPELILNSEASDLVRRFRHRYGDDFLTDEH